MSRHLLRLVSATLVATFALLASAAALCLLPCELTPAVHAGTTSSQGDHCSGSAATETSGAALTGTEGSCADEHRWQAPAADRLGSRAPIGAAAAVHLTPAAPARESAASTLNGTITRAPASPPLLSAPLRI